MVTFYYPRAAYYVLVVFCSITIAIKDDGSYRLPLEVKPTSYTIHLIPYLDEEDPQREFTFDGRVSILMKAQRPERTITLHAKDIKLYSRPNLTEVYSQSPVPVVGTGIDRIRHFLVIGLAKPLIVGSMYRLNISYKGQLTDVPTGFYRSSYLVNGVKRWLATTHFQPISARMAFPCFDEPALKATFNITIARLPEMHVISNMPLKKTVGPVSALKGRYWDVFHTSVRMSTYLVAFVVSDFHCLEDGWLKVWSKPSTVESGEFALSVSPPLLRMMEMITGIRYQLCKLDQVAIPNMFNTAMENWGLIIYNEDGLLLEESTPSERQTIAKTIVHEFAHQWFGNLVTPMWWNDTWLNEGFASFFEFYAAEKVFPKWRLTGQQLASSQAYALWEDCKAETKPLSPPVNTPAEILDSFNELVYEKGGSVLKMLAHAFTPRTFFKGLRIYLQSRAYSSATTDDLSRGIQEAVNEDDPLPEEIEVKAILDSWTLQAGYPVVTVTRSYISNTATLSQGRYNLDSSFTHASKWYIPITYTTSKRLQFSDTKPAFWLSAAENTTVLIQPGRDDWVIYNLKARGYYRVNYDERNWNLLLNALLKHDLKKIHPLNRGALLDDAAYLFTVGLLKLDIVMRLFSYLERERDGIPWLVAFRILEKIYNKIGGSSYFPAFQEIRKIKIRAHKLLSEKAFALHLLSPYYDQVGFEYHDEEDHLCSIIRPELLFWACLLGHEPCMRASSGLLPMRSTTKGNGMDPDFQMVAYCASVRFDGWPSWELVKKVYENAVDEDERVEALYTLGCTSDSELRRRFLNLVLIEESGLRADDRLVVFSAACNGRDPGSCADTLEFMASHIHELGLDPKQLSVTLGHIATRIRTKEELDTWRYIAESLDIQDCCRSELKQAENLALNNLKWLNTTGSHIANWITRHGYKQ